MEDTVEEAPRLPQMTQDLIFIWEEDPFGNNNLMLVKKTAELGQARPLASSTENLKLIEGLWRASRGKEKSLCLFVPFPSFFPLSQLLQKLLFSLSLTKVANLCHVLFPLRDRVPRFVVAGSRGQRHIFLGK